MGEKESSRSRTRVVIVLTNLFSLACLVWTIRDAHLGELRDRLVSMNWSWVAVAVVANLAVYFWQGVRWRLVLRPVAGISFLRVARAIYVGLFANEVLPLRAGEVLRCYLVTRWTGLPFSVSLASGLIERIFDGIWLCLCFIFALRFTPMPPELRYLVDAGYVLGFAVLGGAVVLGVAMFRHQRVPADPPRQGWRRRFAVLLADLGLIGHSRYLAVAFLQSLPYLLLQVIPIWASFLGYGLPGLNLRAAFTLMVILRLSSAVPQAPGNVGLFQFLTKESLERIFHLPAAEAAGFSLVLWGIVTLPLLAAGAVALDVTGAKISELNRAAQQEVGRLKS